MKCPKCGYLGFETGDRCKNCGYDFSLIATAATAPVLDPDLTIRTDDAETGASEVWLDRLDRSLDEASRPKNLDRLIGLPSHPAAVAAPSPPEEDLPLFNPDDPDDIPLIAIPSRPRPPLSVRRTPDKPRLRAVPRPMRAAEPALELFDEEAITEPEIRAGIELFAPEAPARVAPCDDSAGGGLRFVAGLIDHGILFAIDGIVLYFTLRMAGLGVADAGTLPTAPLAMFLVLLKFSYFASFTAVGGQTIGKMAMGIRVVGDRGPVDGGKAIRRTLAGVLSLLTLGLAWIPAFIGSDRRTLHDRLTHTRVIGLPSS